MSAASGPGCLGGLFRPGRLRRLLVATVIVAVGCVEDAGLEDGVAIVRDSAGIRIVEYGGAPTPSHDLGFSREPRFRHGHRVGDYLFQMAWTGALQPDGGAVVGDAGNSEVVLIGADGALRSVLATAGQGPAEVGRLSSVSVLGQDTILVEDDGNGKFMLFEQGELVRTVSTAGDFTLTHGLRTLGVVPPDRALMMTSAFMPGFEGAWLQGHMVVFDLEDAEPDTVAAFDMVPFTPRQGPSNPFSARGVVAASAGRFVRGRTDRGELVWRGLDGEVRQILRWSPEASYPTEGHWNDFEARIRADLHRVNPGRSDAELESMIERSLERYEVDYDVPLPLYLDMSGDGGGGVWLASFVGGFTVEAVPSYDVVAGDGTWLGTVQSPAGFRVLDVAGDTDVRVLGVVTDELGVQSVAVFGLTMEVR